VRIGVTGQRFLAETLKLQDPIRPGAEVIPPLCAKKKDRKYASIQLHLPYPRQRELAMAHGCRFQAIDLRWTVKRPPWTSYG